jgi:hypothetical protein
MLYRNVTITILSLWALSRRFPNVHLPLTALGAFVGRRAVVILAQNILISEILIPSWLITGRCYNKPTNQRKFLIFSYCFSV